jgi:outer membrane protein assembly factor BamB
LNGVLSCLDARTGKVYYEGERLRGLRRVMASPVAANGRIYVTSADGVTKVIAHGPTFEELATNHLDDIFEASPAIAGNEIYLRGREHLYCIAER